MFQIEKIRLDDYNFSEEPVKLASYMPKNGNIESDKNVIINPTQDEFVLLLYVDFNLLSTIALKAILSRFCVCVCVWGGGVTPYLNIKAISSFITYDAFCVCGEGLVWLMARFSIDFNAFCYKSRCKES